MGFTTGLRGEVLGNTCEKKRNNNKNDYDDDDSNSVLYFNMLTQHLHEPIRVSTRRLNTWIKKQDSV
jgi:hypothetical protein